MNIYDEVVLGFFFNIFTAISLFIFIALIEDPTKCHLILYRLLIRFDSSGE